MKKCSLFSGMAIFIALLLIIPLSGRARAQDTINLWLHPFLPATQLIKQFTPLADYLSSKIGQPVAVKISKNYQDHIDRVGENRIDLAYMGPAPYVKMTRIYGEKPLLARIEVKGKSFFFGMIVVRQDSPLKMLSDLDGKKFCFGDKNSTMSHMVPRYMLLKAGIPVDRLSKYDFLTSHRNVALGVLGEYYDAGALKESVYSLYKDRGLRVLAKSPPVPVHLLVARDDFPPEKIALLRRALLELKDDTRGPAIFAPMTESVTGFMPVQDEDYDGLRRIIEMVTEREE